MDMTTNNKKDCRTDVYREYDLMVDKDMYNMDAFEVIFYNATAELSFTRDAKKKDNIHVSLKMNDHKEQDFDILAKELYFSDDGDVLTISENKKEDMVDMLQFRYDIKLRVS